jgi:hypothetical protein
MEYPVRLRNEMLSRLKSFVKSAIRLCKGEKGKSVV